MVRTCRVQYRPGGRSGPMNRFTPSTTIGLCAGPCLRSTVRASFGKELLAMPKLPSRWTGRPLDSSTLLGSPLLAALSKEDLQALVKVSRVRSWGAEQTLFQRGDPCDGIYAIVSGEVRIVLEGANGSEVLVRLLTTGDVF